MEARRRRLRSLAAVGALVAGTVAPAAGHLRRRRDEDHGHRHLHSAHSHGHPHHHHAPAHAQVRPQMDRGQSPRHLAENVFEGDLNPEYTSLSNLGGDYYQADYHGGENVFLGGNTNIVGSDLPDLSDYHHAHPDVFDSCLMMCYCDMVQRWGRAFAAQKKAEGFVFEECEEDRDNCPEGEMEPCEVGEEGCVDGRRLGSTDQAHRMWNRPDYRGSDGKLHIPYAIKDTAWFTQETLDTVASALAHIESMTGVLKFVPRTTQAEYIYFNYEERYAAYCAANIGRQTNYRTNVYLGWCKKMQHHGNVVHEILHALGFWHEHSRPDRDEHVAIAWDNIRENAKNNFAKAAGVHSRGSPFDFTSIMMYPARAFSTNYQDTIVPIDGLEDWETMGQRAQLSRHDVEQLRMLYQCASGPRGTSLDAISKDDLCSTDCPCWEHAMGECTSDAECMGDLVCDVTPSPLPQPSYVDQLPTTLPPGTTSFSCNDYCHPNCCYYANSIMRCPETCDSAPPYEPPAANEVPAKMCQVGDGSGGQSTTSTTLATTTATSTTTSTTTTTSATTTTTTGTTTTTTESNVGMWYSDWNIEECVQCDGSSACGDDGTAFFDTQDACCTSGPLNYLDYDACMGGATSPPTTSPTPSPTSAPSASPTEREIQIGGDTWYYQWETNKCVKDCKGPTPCTDRRKHKSERGHKSVQDCCGYMMPNASVTECSDADVRWYPAEETCLNDGNAPEEVKRMYSNQNKCCRRHFRKGIMDCLGIDGWGQKFGRLPGDEEGEDYNEEVDDWVNN